MKPGDKITATIRQVVEYGLWLQYQEHTSILVEIIRISWGRVNLKKSFAVGQECELTLLHEITNQSCIETSPLRKAGYPILYVWSGSMKDPAKDPWREPLPVKLEERVEGVIYSVTSYGFFVELGREGFDGLVREEGSTRQAGERCVVIPREIDIETRRITLELVSPCG